MISADGPDSVIAVLGHALLREDAGFHMFQVFEAGCASMAISGADLRETKS